MSTPPQQSAADSRISRLAVASAISGSVLCCPLTSVVGIILGWMALRVIRRSGGTVHGVKYAYIGILAGTLALGGQLLAVSKLQSAAQASWERQTVDAIEQVFAQPRSARRFWIRDAQRAMSDADLEAVVTRLIDTHGPLTRASVQPPFVPAGVGERRLAIPITLHFESGASRTGGVTVVTVPQGIDPFGGIMLVEIAISDPDGEIHLPSRD